jgi:hypothetical protein
VAQTRHSRTPTPASNAPLRAAPAQPFGNFVAAATGHKKIPLDVTDSPESSGNKEEEEGTQLISVAASLLPLFCSCGIK